MEILNIGLLNAPTSSLSTGKTKFNIEALFRQLIGYTDTQKKIKK